MRLVLVQLAPVRPRVIPVPGQAGRRTPCRTPMNTALDKAGTYDLLDAIM